MPVCAHVQMWVGIQTENAGSRETFYIPGHILPSDRTCSCVRVCFGKWLIALSISGCWWKEEQKGLTLVSSGHDYMSSCWDIGKSPKHWLSTWLNYNWPVTSQALWWSCLLCRLGCSAVLVQCLRNSKGRNKANLLRARQRTSVLRVLWGPPFRQASDCCRVIPANKGRAHPTFTMERI